MSNTLIEVGSRPNGSFGSAIAAPSGYHPRTVDPENNILGFRGVDPSINSWASLTFGDYFTPGDPYESFGIQVGANYYWNSNYHTDLTGGAWGSASTSGTGGAAQWGPDLANGIKVTQSATVNPGEYILRVSVTFENTTGSASGDIYYVRELDADNCQAQDPAVADVSCWTTTAGSGPYGNTYSTLNTIVKTGAGGSEVKATQGDGSYMGLRTSWPDAVAYVLTKFYACDSPWGSTAPKNIYDKTYNDDDGWCLDGAQFTPGFSQLLDKSMGIAFKIPSLAPGQSTTVNFEYVLADPEAPVLPPAPANVVATAGAQSASVAFDPVDWANSYTATCISTDGGVEGSATGSSSPLVVNNLTGGKTYTCTVVATDGTDTSGASDPSNAFVPTAAPNPPPKPSNPIPTLSEWAQIVMMLMMIATAGWYGWRVKRH